MIMSNPENEDSAVAIINLFTPTEFGFPYKSLTVNVMQSTPVLNVESTTSHTLPKSTSLRAMEDRKYELSSSLDLQLGKERRNSISSLFSGRSRFSERQGSVPTVSQKTATVTRSSASLHSQSPKYISLKLYQYFLRGEQNTNNGSSEQTLDETFAKIQNQLSEMSCESRVVQQRLSSLSQAITDLSEQISPVEKQPCDKCLTMPKAYKQQQRQQFNTLPRILPAEQVHNQLPLIVINGWDSTGNSVSSESTTPNTSQESELDLLLEIENEEKYPMHCVRSTYDGVGSESEGSGEMEGDNDDNVFGITER